MDAINAIFTRRSTREFTEQSIESEKLHQILDAAMSGPCCVNARDWSFVVVTEKAKLQKMAALGISSVWLGTWQQMDRVQRQKELWGLPDTVIPHSVIALGYPAEDITTPRKSRYEENRVHFNEW